MIWSLGAPQNCQLEFARCRILDTLSLTGSMDENLKKGAFIIGTLGIDGKMPGQTIDDFVESLLVRQYGIYGGSVHALLPPSRCCV